MIWMCRRLFERKRTEGISDFRFKIADWVAHTGSICNRHRVR